MNMQTIRLDNITVALQEECYIRAFLSGGGLRVVRIEKSDILKGYGEHPYIAEALVYADEDFKKGGRSYKEVYGRSLEHYLTGSSEASDELDAWILRSRKFEAWQKEQIVFFKLTSIAEVKISQEIINLVCSTGQDVEWKHRGYTYKSYMSSWGTQQQSVSTKVIKKPNEERNNAACWMYPISKTGQGSDFWEACQNAFKAPEVETP